MKEEIPETGPFLCYCSQWDLVELRAEVIRRNLRTVEDVYARLLGGGACRSCAPEIAKLLSEVWEGESGAARARST